MIGALLAALTGSAWARTALRYGVTAIAILLFLLALRRSGERAGRLAERLETKEKIRSRFPTGSGRTCRWSDSMWAACSSHLLF